MFKKKTIAPLSNAEEPEEVTSSITVMHKKRIGTLEVEITVTDDSLTGVDFSTPYDAKGYYGMSMYDLKSFTGKQYNDLIALLEWAKKTIPEFTDGEDKTL